MRIVKEYFEKNLKIDLKQNKINDIGLKSVLQLLADKDLRGAEILLNRMVRLESYFICIKIFIFYSLIIFVIVVVVELWLESKDLSDMLFHAIQTAKRLFVVRADRQEQAERQRDGHDQLFELRWSTLLDPIVYAGHSKQRSV